MKVLIETQTRVTPTKVDSTKIEPEVDVSKYEIFQDGEWKAIDIRALKKDQIFRIDGNKICKAYKDSFEHHILGWGVIYDSLDKLRSVAHGPSGVQF